MFHKEIKDLLNQLNNENVEELKPMLARKLEDHYWHQSMWYFLVVAKYN